MEKMTNERSRHLPVIRDEKLVGVVSIGDMVKHQLGECQYEHKAMQEYIATGWMTSKIWAEEARSCYLPSGLNWGKTDHIAVDAEDALIAALKVKTEHPEAVITYVRQQNRRGDARHPSHALVENAHWRNRNSASHFGDSQQHITRLGVSLKFDALTSSGRAPHTVYVAVWRSSTYSKELK
jgi:hypothetical protein